MQCENIMFGGQTDLSQRINLFYDNSIHHYHVTIVSSERWQNDTCAKLVVRFAGEGFYTHAKFRIFTVLPAYHMFLIMLEFLVLIVVDIFEVRFVTKITSRINFLEKYLRN
jgi:hypothetical protein